MEWSIANSNAFKCSAVYQYKMKKENKLNLHIRLTKKQLDWLRKEAKKGNISIAQVVRELIDKNL